MKLVKTMQTIAVPATHRPEAAQIKGRSEQEITSPWTAFEAAVRLSLTDLGQQTDNPIWVSDSPQGLLVQAVAYGVIDPEDREMLLRFLSQRNAVSGQGEAVDAETLRQIEHITKRTLDEMK